MTAKLEKTIKRELELKGQHYTVSVGPEGVKITPKGGRKGHAMSWETLLSGDAELYADMKMSVDALKGSDPS
ncbi:MAG: hypothetical protein ABI679_08345 [Gemmatimonadota bacterium]